MEAIIEKRNELKREGKTAVNADGEATDGKMSNLKPVVLKMPPSMSRIVTVPLWMTARVQSCVIAEL